MNKPPSSDKLSKSGLILDGPVRYPDRPIDESHSLHSDSLADPCLRCQGSWGNGMAGHVGDNTACVDPDSINIFDGLTCHAEAAQGLTDDGVFRFPVLSTLSFDEVQIRTERFKLLLLSYDYWETILYPDRGIVPFGSHVQIYCRHISERLIASLPYNSLAKPHFPLPSDNPRLLMRLLMNQLRLISDKIGPIVLSENFPFHPRPKKLLQLLRASAIGDYISEMLHADISGLKDNEYLSLGLFTFPIFDLEVLIRLVAGRQSKEISGTRFKREVATLITSVKSTPGYDSQVILLCADDYWASLGGDANG